MRSDGYDAKVTTLLYLEGFFKDRRSYLGHTVEDSEPHLHLEGEDRSALRDWLFKKGNICQLRLPGCTRIATEMDHDGEAVDGTRFDERRWVRRVCASCHKKRHNREISNPKLSVSQTAGGGAADSDNRSLGGPAEGETV